MSRELRLAAKVPRKPCQEENRFFSKNLLRALDELKQALEGAEVVVPERQTSYTAREMTVRALCGTLVGLALAD